MQFSHIETENYHFQYIEQGKGFPLIFMHGYPGRPQDFRWLFPYLSEFKIISLALPCLGLTKKKETVTYPTTIKERADSIEEFLENKNIEQCLVFAHSMGGPIGTALTKQASDRVIGLILVASVGLYPYRAFRMSKPALAHKLLSNSLLNLILRPVMKNMFYRLGFPKGVSVKVMHYVLHCAHDFSFQEHSENISALECPVLSIWSEDDSLIEMQSQLDLSKVIKNGKNLSFPTGGHNPQRKFPEEIAKGFKDWLKQSGLFSEIEQYSLQKELAQSPSALDS